MSISALLIANNGVSAVLSAILLGLIQILQGAPKYVYRFNSTGKANFPIFQMHLDMRKGTEGFNSHCQPTRKCKTDSVSVSLDHLSLLHTIQHNYIANNTIPN